jgi:hypothetical protein
LVFGANLLLLNWTCFPFLFFLSISAIKLQGPLGRAFFESENGFIGTQRESSKRGPLEPKPEAAPPLIIVKIDCVDQSQQESGATGGQYNYLREQ